jgi:hypothetical protein
MKDCAFVCASQNGEETVDTTSLDNGIEDILNNQLRLKDVSDIIGFSPLWE